MNRVVRTDCNAVESLDLVPGGDVATISCLNIYPPVASSNGVPLGTVKPVIVSSNHSTNDVFNFFLRCDTAIVILETRM